jgi:hypothetical protein
MVLIELFLRRRHFSQTSRINKYATNKQKELVEKARKIMRQNQVVEGMNEMNTNYLEIAKPKPSSLELKPV